jgi:hypothetical protein
MEDARLIQLPTPGDAFLDIASRSLLICTGQMTLDLAEGRVRRTLALLGCRPWGSLSSESSVLRCD